MENDTLYIYILKKKKCAGGQNKNNRDTNDIYCTRDKINPLIVIRFDVAQQNSRRHIFYTVRTQREHNIYIILCVNIYMLRIYFGV